MGREEYLENLSIRISNGEPGLIMPQDWLTQFGHFHDPYGDCRLIGNSNEQNKENEPDSEKLGYSFKIRRVCNMNLERAIFLGQDVFCYENYPRELNYSLRESLKSQKLGRDMKRLDVKSQQYKEAKSFLEEYGMSIYWVAEDPKVVGLTGLAWDNDDSGIVWLGWFCVDSRKRGKKIGSKLLDYSIRQAKRRGFEKLRLWTSTLPFEKNAQGLYESRGLIIYDRERVRKTKSRKRGFTKLYRELEL